MPVSAVASHRSSPSGSIALRALRHVADVGEAGDAGESGGEHGSAPLVGLGLQGAAHSGALEAEVDAADAGEG